MKVLSSSKKFRSESVIGKNITLSGRMSGEGDLRIEGNFSGELEITGKLSLANSANLEANIKANELSINCNMKGDVEVNYLELMPDASLAGNLIVNEIKIEDGAKFNGIIDMDFELPQEI